MAHFFRANEGVYVNLDLVAKVVADNADEPSRFDCFDANGALIARIAAADFDPPRETAPVVPARSGETAFIVSTTGYNDNRPTMADVEIEEKAVIAWRVVSDRGAEPVFAEHPFFEHITFFRMPSGRLRCEANMEEFADVDELRAYVLRDVQDRWDWMFLKSASDTSRAAMH